MRRFLSRPAGWLLCWTLLPLPGCIDPFMPPSVSTPPSYLVVDGFINSQGISTINLSRTYAIALAASPPTENSATVFVEAQSGRQYPLRESAVKGTYVSDALTLNPADTYRLHLTTATGKEYASAFVPVKTTPPIDTVDWRVTGSEVDITVSTHDPASATRYYRWEFAETWEIVSPYIPSLEFSGGRLRPLSAPYPALCWRTTRGTTVQLASTAALSQDVVAAYPLRQLPSTAPQLLRRYSLLVQQHALTKDEHQYWELLRKNTESIGSLFGPEPVQLTGNVRGLGSNAAAIALGYVGAHSLREKRIFIARPQLPAAWRPLTGYESCLPPDTVRPGTESYSFGSNYLPIYATYKNGGLVGYLAATADCIDCRRRGTATRPVYWP
ncbi:hypothetical protein GCM10022409_14600 [Hymenobacter glaciei]|uniref:DUF4249 domain-containing protein n=1 Tax=Hymenobacter glaciei TaxID=877209 RepID=A0ABP7TUG2_9BACT